MSLPEPEEGGRAGGGGGDVVGDVGQREAIGAGDRRQVAAPGIAVAGAREGGILEGEVVAAVPASHCRMYWLPPLYCSVMFFRVSPLATPVPKSAVSEAMRGLPMMMVLAFAGADEGHVIRKVARPDRAERALAGGAPSPML